MTLPKYRELIKEKIHVTNDEEKLIKQNAKIVS